MARPLLSLQALRYVSLRHEALIYRHTLRLLTGLVALALLAALVATPSANANGNGDEDDDDDDGGPGAKGAGSAAIGLLALGFLYVGLRWFAKPIRELMAQLGLPRKAFALTLRHSLTLHTVVMVLATVAAAYHSVLLWKGKWDVLEVGGLLAVVVMTYLSVAGALLWLRLPKDWFGREARKVTRLLHAQRLTTFLLVLGLALHLLGED